MTDFQDPIWSRAQIHLMDEKGCASGSRRGYADPFWRRPQPRWREIFVGPRLPGRQAPGHHCSLSNDKPHSDIAGEAFVPYHENAPILPPCQPASR